ncbi:hypothetical protein QBD01_002732 [Ochrobactrum sp. 19YEA23]|uniref:hypothetical protein n=1 Tax=Ochrobactrum sp. 19YEA23 TaxID=3039854 RepID=UPI00247A2B06|nr:hypothetical protein [Ochrobactrum sp. 19YEA23]
MKKRYEDWRKLSIISHKVEKKEIIMRNFPIVLQIEDNFIIYGRENGQVDPSVEGDLAELSIALFGVNIENTLFRFPDRYWKLSEDSMDFWDIDKQYEVHESRFQTANASEDETVEILLKLGLDFRDANGWPLRCTRYLCRQAEAAAKGIMGTLPDTNLLALQVWESALERSAKQFIKLKKKS